MGSSGSISISSRRASAVTTATLFFPSALDQSRVCLPCVQQEGRRLKHSVLGEQKTRMVEQIAQLPRRSAAGRAVFCHARPTRRRMERAMPLRDWEQRYEQAELQSSREARCSTASFSMPSNRRRG